MSDPKNWRLWGILKRRGLRMQDYASLVGYSRAHLQRVKSGEREPSKALKILTQTALGIPADFLFSEEE